jgi:hypothetical protein
MPSFNATIALLGVNPYVSVPGPVLKALFAAAGRDKGPIPIKVTIASACLRQTLVRYHGDWRLYLNTEMRKVANKQVGDRLKLVIEFDPAPRTERKPPAFERALRKDTAARQAFDELTPSRQKEILRYLNNLKTKESLTRSVTNVVSHLRGETAGTLTALMRTIKPARKRAVTQK